jgi:predicted Zn finger-like uncharacterized protein
MRLICTECNAQYEIDAALLPETGREVQCSSCGHVWFQEKNPASSKQQPTDLRTTDIKAEQSSPPSSSVEPNQTLPTQRKIDDKVLGILREEAEFEARQRAREAGGLETQPDLGLTSASSWPSSRPPKTPISPQDTPDEGPKPAQTAFPDIEDISASLEPIGSSRMGRSNAEFDLPVTASERKRSFWVGLSVPVGLSGILLAPYLLAPEIISALPATEPALTGYVHAVDVVRIRLADLFTS